MKTISAFETTDGKIFKSNDDAIQHQNDIDLRNDLDGFLRNKGTYSDFNTDFINLVVENRNDLLRMLS